MENRALIRFGPAENEPDPGLAPVSMLRNKAALWLAACSFDPTAHSFARTARWT